MATSLTLRSAKGSALTHTEMDNNLTALRTTADDALPASDAVVISGTKTALVDADTLIVRDSEDTNTPKEVTRGNLMVGRVVGPTSATDNALARFDTTTGKLLQNSGVVVSDANEISGYRGHLNLQTGTTYTLVAADTGKVVECTNASAITVTLPADAAVGFVCSISQGGAGQITLSPAGSATLRNRQTHTKTAGQWGAVNLYVRTNAGGTAAEYVMNGDSAA